MAQTAPATPQREWDVVRCLSIGGEAKLAWWFLSRDGASTVWTSPAAIGEDQGRSEACGRRALAALVDVGLVCVSLKERGAWRVELLPVRPATRPRVVSGDPQRELDLSEAPAQAPALPTSHDQRPKSAAHEDQRPKALQVMVMGSDGSAGASAGQPRAIADVLAELTTDRGGFVEVLCLAKGIEEQVGVKISARGLVLEVATRVVDGRYPYEELLRVLHGLSSARDRAAYFVGAVRRSMRAHDRRAL